MQLKPLDTPELLRTAVGWLSQKENYQWLDFGDGRQQVSPEWLKTANFLIVLGDRSYAKQGYATRAGLATLTLGFRELGLHAIHTWIVEGNHSVHLARNMNFKPIGRQRQCHYIDGQPY